MDTNKVCVSYLKVRYYNFTEYTVTVRMFSMISGCDRKKSANWLTDDRTVELIKVEKVAFEKTGPNFYSSPAEYFWLAN